MSNFTINLHQNAPTCFGLTTIIRELPFVLCLAKKQSTNGSLPMMIGKPKHVGVFKCKFWHSFRAI